MNYLETAPSQLQEPVTLHRGFLPIFGGDVVEKKSETAIVGNVRVNYRVSTRATRQKTL